MTGELEGQRAIVTGATRGIGRSVTKGLLAQGATVIGVYAVNVEAAAAFQRECEAFADRLHLYRCDVAKQAEVLDFFEVVEERFNSIEILVNGAGIRRDSVLAMMREEDWQRVIDVNLTGSFHMAKQAVLLMLKGKYGRIIFITSPMAHMGFAGLGNYAASKAGQIGMAKALAKETAKRKITVNCVSPGFIDTELLEGLDKEQLEEYKRMVPMRRFGTPQEVTEAVLFLASAKAAYITGSVLEVTGGL